jgi:predicted N-acetyltransferase YhbS
MTVRAEEPADHDAVRDVVSRAFGDPGIADLVADLRPAAVSLVAEVDGRVVGHVMGTPGWVDAPARLVDVWVLSPLAVAPEYQRRGIGAELVTRLLAALAGRGAPLVFLEGHPDYYPRFGFRPGRELGFTRPSTRIPAAAFQVATLPGYSPWMTGTLVYPDVFWRHDAVGLRTEPADFARAPNIADNTDLYEKENAAIDPDGVLWQALRDQADWRGKTLLDLGCGTGFWLPRYADAAHVIGVEPDPALRAGAPRCVIAGSAEQLPLPDDSVDVVHARFAYFFPPDCEPGWHEVMRVLRPGGTLVVVDNDRGHGEFAELLTASPWVPPDAGEWWRRMGAQRVDVLSAWRFDTPADLVDVLRIEFPGDLVDAWTSRNPDRGELSYGYTLYVSRSS